jgi:hypothetical protein
MPLDGYHTITVSDWVFQQVIAVMTEYECESVADAVGTASAIALNREEAKLAQILADRLAE